jgi:aromatic amino acid aminotransferase I
VPDATRDEPERTSSFVISWLRKVFGKEARDEQKLLLMPRYPKAPKELTMTAILQYAPAAGLPSLNTMLHEFTSRLYQPAYENFATLLHSGSTDG